MDTNRELYNTIEDLANKIQRCWLSASHCPVKDNIMELSHIRNQLRLLCNQQYNTLIELSNVVSNDTLVVIQDKIDSIE